MGIFSGEAAAFVAKDSPFAIFCIMILFIQYLTYRSYTKRQAENFKTSLEVIQTNYEKNLEFLSRTLDPSLINKFRGKK